MRLLPRELHTTDRPSSTAQWTTLGRALELDRPPEQRIVTDPFAPVFLTPAYQATLRGLQLGRRLVRAGERAELAGLAAFALCRHRFIDEHLLGAAGRQPDKTAEQVLILGAGYDARAYRFAGQLAGCPVYEVDLAPLSRRKAAIVARRPDLFGHAAVHRVEIDFRRDSLDARLRSAGFSVGVPAFVAWEGVSMYLTREAVSSTLRTLAGVLGPGSTLALDLWHPPAGGAPKDVVRRVGAKAIRLVGEPVTFGLSPKQAPGFLAAHGFSPVDIALSDELAARYATDGRTCEKSVYTVAARLIS